MIIIRRATEENEYGTQAYAGGLDIFDTTKTGTSYYDGVIRNPAYYKREKGIQGHIEMMSPIEYFQACVDGFNQTGDYTSLSSQIREAYSERTQQKLLKVLNEDRVKITMPYLNYSEGGFAQEGRHRMYLAMSLFGEDAKFPVLIVEDAPIEKNIEPYLVNDGNRYGVKDSRSGNLILGPMGADELKAVILESMNEYPKEVRGKMATIAWDAYYMEHPDDDDIEESATEGVAYESKFTDSLKKFGQQIVNAAKDVGDFSRRVGNQIKYGTNEEKEIKDKGGKKAGAVTKLEDALTAAKWDKMSDEDSGTNKNIFQKTQDSRKLVALTNDGGYKQSFVIIDPNVTSRVDISKTRIDDLLQKAGATKSDKFVRFADAGKEKKDADDWVGKKQLAASDPKAAEKLNNQYRNSSNLKKKQLLEDNLPRVLSSGKGEVISILQGIKDPFTSTYFKLVNDYAGNKRDISKASAKTLFDNEDFFTELFKQRKDWQGINLSSSDFQLRAIKKFDDSGLSLKTLQKPNGGWLSIEQMKKAIESHDYTGEEEEKLRKTMSRPTEMSKKAYEYMRHMSDPKNMKNGKPLTLNLANQVLQRKDDPLTSLLQLNDDEISLLFSMLANGGSGNA